MTLCPSEQLPLGSRREEERAASGKQVHDVCCVSPGAVGGRSQ